MKCCAIILTPLRDFINSLIHGGWYNHATIHYKILCIKVRLRSTIYFMDFRDGLIKVWSMIISGFKMFFFLRHALILNGCRFSLFLSCAFSFFHLFTSNFFIFYCNKFVGIFFTFNKKFLIFLFFYNRK